MTSNATDTLVAISAARMGWMTGQIGPVDLPELAQLDTNEAHLRLLALDAQLRGAAGAAQTGVELTHAAKFNAPQQAYPSATARDRFRRLWSDLQQADKVLLLRLMDRRGYIAHPLDFMPTSNWDGLPDAYAPLLDWHRTFHAGDEPAEADPYTAYSRVNAQRTYADLRAHDPAKAQAWLAGELAAGNAQNRLRLLRDLSNQLDQTDVDFLLELQANDRSGKVTSFVLSVLRRLGAKTDLPDDLGALDYIEQSTKGLLRRKQTFSVPAKMNATRVNLLSTLIAQMGFPAVADHLSVSETALIDAWDWDGSHVAISDALRQSILETGSDTACQHLIHNFPDALLQLSHLGPDLMQRLSPPLRDKAIEATMTLRTGTANMFWQIPATLCTWQIEDLSPTQSAALMDKAARQSNLALSEHDDAPDLGKFSTQIFRFAMCLHPKDAQLALDHFASKYQLHSADPILAPFYFNMALPPVPTGTPTERP